MDAWLALAPLEGFPTAEAGVAPEERARAAGLCPPGRRREFLAGRALLRALLTLVGGRAGEAAIVADARGALRLAGSAPWRVSISHSGRRVAAAVCSGAPVGVDVEEADRDVDLPAILARFAHPEEASRVLRAPTAEERLSGFFRLWTLKEAAAKSMGVGLGTDFRLFRVGAGRGWSAVLGLGHPCFAVPLAPDGASFAALAVAAPSPPRRPIDMSAACAALLCVPPAGAGVARTSAACPPHPASLRRPSACPT